MSRPRLPLGCLSTGSAPDIRLPFSVSPRAVCQPSPPSNVLRPARGSVGPPVAAVQASTVTCETARARPAFPGRLPASTLRGRLTKWREPRTSSRGLGPSGVHASWWREQCREVWTPARRPGLMGRATGGPARAKCRQRFGAAPNKPVRNARCAGGRPHFHATWRAEQGASAPEGRGPVASRIQRRSRGFFQFSVPEVR